MPHVKVPARPREQPLPIKIVKGTLTATVGDGHVTECPAP